MNVPISTQSPREAPGGAHRRFGSDSTARGIRVRVTAGFEPDHSDLGADSPQYIFSYRIRITNVGSAPARLMSRYWLIIDSCGGREEAGGEGVIGQQPRLTPGESFEYASFCRLPTSWGTMEGCFTMLQDDGDVFEVPVVRFCLAPREEAAAV